jgi:SAM-dependent methyltransferase
MLSNFRRYRYARDVRVLDHMPLFAPFSSGSPPARAELAIQAADQVFPLLVRLLADANRSPLLPVRRPTEFCGNAKSHAAAQTLKGLFEKYGSDKSSTHDYHFIYGHVLSGSGEITRILEIGLGSNNEDVVSNMGRMGKPGASLRAFRDFLPRAKVFGADVDRRVLFEEDRIKTYFVDQTDLRTFDDLGQEVGRDFDLIIDDGLHTINANLAVIIFGLPRLKAGGWLVIEDISPNALPAWHIVASLMPDNVQCHLIEALGGLVFAIQSTKIQTSPIK